MSKGSIILRSSYATCLALATITHVLVDARYGVFLAGLEPLRYPIGVRLYWASLTFLDLAQHLIRLSPLLGVLQNAVAPMIIDNLPFFDLIQGSKAAAAGKVIV